ncbi:MAG: hypothetical protein ACPGSI_15060 [Pikeienuella sp.]
MSDLNDLSNKIDRLLEKSDGVEPHIFNEAEVKDLQRVLIFVNRIDALGWWGRWAFYLVVTAGAIIANWDRIRGFFKG